MMTYKEYVEALMEELELRGNKDEYEFLWGQTMKNNDDEKDSIMIKYNDGQSMSVRPVVYPEKFYQNYEEWGQDVADAADKIFEIAEREKMRLDEARNAVAEVKKENAGESLMLRLYNRDWNTEMLKDVVYMPIEGTDLVAVAVWQFRDFDGGGANMRITTTVQQHLEMTADEILEVAYKNTIGQEYRLKPMSELMKDMFGEDFEMEDAWEEKMYVLSNKESLYGATALLNKRLLKEVEDKVKEPFYIIPSSIHEILIVPESQCEPETLRQSCLEVNATQVEVEERLGNNIFYFVGNKLHICNTKEEAMEHKMAALEPKKEEKQTKTQRRTV